MKHSLSTLSSDDSAEPRTQYAAICWRKAKSGIEVLLITSRETRRWVVPKGWPIRGIDGPHTAEREAWEEAGVEGKVSKNCLGLFSYQKVLDRDQCVPCVVAVYGLHVGKLSRRYPEQGQRQRKWFTAAEAAELVLEPELRTIFLAVSDGSLAVQDVPLGKKTSPSAR